MRPRSLAFLVCIVALLAGCQEKGAQDTHRHEPKQPPKTSYGQALEGAKALQSTAQQRAQELDEQLEDDD